MKSRAEQSQRQVDIGCEDEDEERRLELDPSVEQAQTDFDRDDGGADRRDHFEREGGEERDAQHAERRIAKLLAHACDRGDLVAAASEDFERRQALQDVEEMRAHHAQRGVLPTRQKVCRAADQKHKQRNERRGQQQDDAGENIERKDDREHRKWHERGEDELRQVLAVVRFERFDAIDRGGDEFAGAFAARVGGSECNEMIEEAFAQSRLDARGDAERGHFAAPREERARGDDRQQREERAPHRVARRAA